MASFVAFHNLCVSGACKGTDLMVAQGLRRIFTPRSKAQIAKAEGRFSTPIGCTRAIGKLAQLI